MISKQMCGNCNFRWKCGAKTPDECHLDEWMKEISKKETDIARAKRLTSLPKVTVGTEMFWIKNPWRSDGREDCISV